MSEPETPLEETSNDSDHVARLYDAISTILPDETAFVLVYTRDDDTVLSVSNLPPNLAKELAEGLNGPTLGTRVMSVARDC